jgi:hypothetical protein
MPDHIQWIITQRNEREEMRRILADERKKRARKRRTRRG